MEIFHQEEWHTVCDDSFDAAAAGVVCRALGYRAGRTDGGVLPHPFGAGRGKVSKVSCEGDEDRLKDCVISRIYCKHHEDVGVVCWN